jgi:SAM-dependent methyltransferase
MEWDDYAETWDADEKVHDYAEQAYAALSARLADSQFELSGRRVLDFGCGTGSMTLQLAPNAGEVIALDASAKMIEVLEDKLAQNSVKNVSSLCGDLEQGFAHEKLEQPFSLIVASSVCAFVDDYPKRVCKDDELRACGIDAEIADGIYGNVDAMRRIETLTIRGSRVSRPIISRIGGRVFRDPRVMERCIVERRIVVGSVTSDDVHRCIVDGRIVDGCIVDGCIVDGCIVDGCIVDGCIVDGCIVDGCIVDGCTSLV